jgi:mono/diheme cytochrome c family protein
MAAAVLITLVASGCSPQVELGYTPREELKDAPAKHQQQIADALGKYFGTPRFPKFIQVAPEDKQPADAKEPLLSKQWTGCNCSTGAKSIPGNVPGVTARRAMEEGRRQRISTRRRGTIDWADSSSPVRHAGAKPRREDLARIIRHGAKGTSMPTFRWMAQEDLDAVIDYVMLLSSRGEVEFRLMKIAESQLGEEDNIDPQLVAEQAQLIAQSWADADTKIVRPLSPQLQYSQESIDAGARAFVQLNCYKCHGRDGRGNKQFDVGKDDGGGSRMPLT